MQKKKQYALYQSDYPTPYFFINLLLEFLIVVFIGVFIYIFFLFGQSNYLYYIAINTIIFAFLFILVSLNVFYISKTKKYSIYRRGSEIEIVTKNVFFQIQKKKKIDIKDVRCFSVDDVDGKIIFDFANPCRLYAFFNSVDKKEVLCTGKKDELQKIISITRIKYNI